MTSSHYSISAAHRITGKSRTTISKHIKAGKLSVTKDADGNPLIDASELIRVYGGACDFSQEEGGPPAPQPSHTKGSRSTVQAAQPELHTLQTQLDKEIAERERERNQYRQQIQTLEDALQRAQEGHNRATLLLEQRASGGGELADQLKRLEQRLDAHQQKREQELVELERQAREQAKQDILSRPWWEVAWGRS